MSVDVTPQGSPSRADIFAAAEWADVWKKWRDSRPEPFCAYIKELERRVYAEQGRTSVANLRATMAEKRERDTGLAIERLKRRIAELESGRS